MTTLLPLAHDPRVNPDGTLSIGALTLPVWMAQDLAHKLLAACGQTSHALDSRARVVAYVDRLFDGAHLVTVRDMADHGYATCPAVRDDDTHAWVRLGSTTAVRVLREGARGRGFALSWREDGILGIVPELVMPMVRVSVGWASCARLGVWL